MRKALATIGIPASLLACSPNKTTALPTPPGPTSQATTQATSQEAEKIRLSRSSLRTNENYEGMALWINLEQDNQSGGVVMVDLRSVVNIFPDAERMLDPYSFSSMIQGGSIEEATYLLTEEAGKRINDSPLEEELSGKISPKISKRIARKDYPQIESEEASIEMRNLSPLISFKEPPATNYYFRRPAISTGETLPNLTKKEAEKQKSLGDRALMVCLNKLEGAELRKYQEDRVKYRSFSVESIFRTEGDSVEPSYAGLGIRFKGNKGPYDVIGVLDLRGVENPEDINPNDLQAMAFWGDSTGVYATQEASGALATSRYLKARFDAVFTPNTISQVSEDESHVREGKLGKLLSSKAPSPIRHFHKPGIFPCKTNPEK